MLFALCHAVFSFAQHTHLTLEESKEIKGIAMKKVESKQTARKLQIPTSRFTKRPRKMDTSM